MEENHKFSCLLSWFWHQVVFQLMSYPKMYILPAILEWNKRSEHVSKVEIQYNKIKFFSIYIFVSSL